MINLKLLFFRKLSSKKNNRSSLWDKDNFVTIDKHHFIPKESGTYEFFLSTPIITKNCQVTRFEIINQ